MTCLDCHFRMEIRWNSTEHSTEEVPWMRVVAEHYSFLPSSVFLACGVINLGGILEPMPASSKMDLPLAKAKPISASVITYLRRKTKELEKRPFETGERSEKM
ncbi:zinc finger protein 462-like [Grus japonensis]|uniref:Zinc finger protein 462-like n=1 Tax=Grus japonensis TaxID=30415 RepID=A0ABC9WMA2_GRUJA